MRLDASWDGLDDRRFYDCVHCGLCLSACPTYVELGTEMDSPRGRIYLLKGLADGTLSANADVVRHLDLCLGCRACETACPSGVRYGELLEAGRAHLRRAPQRSLSKSLRSRLVCEIFPYPQRLRRLLAPVRWLQKAGLGGLLRRLVPAAALLPELAGDTTLAEETPSLGTERHRVGLVIGCVNRVLFSATNAATVRVLARNGCSVAAPSAQPCCGALHLHGGDREQARVLARAMIDAFPEGLDAIVANAAGCGATLKEYGHLLRDDGAYAARARAFAAKVRDVTEFVAALPPEPPRCALSGRATYHDACHLAHAQGVRQAPRDLIAMIPGLETIELAEADHCCGSAGSYNLTEPAMAERLQRRKAENVKATRARFVLVANPGCALQIAAGLRHAGGDAEVLHPIELLDRAYGEAP